MKYKDLQAIFLDRDGCIGGDGNYCHPDDFNLYPYTLEAMDLLRKAGLRIFAFTNQQKIAFGLATREQFEEQLLSYGFEKVYLCPHAAGSGCPCRKPSPKMLFDAAEDFNLDLSKCVVFGDMGTDMMSADRAGAIKIMLRTGLGQLNLGEKRSSWAEVEPDYIADNLLEGVKWLLAQMDKE